MKGRQVVMCSENKVDHLALPYKFPLSIGRMWVSFIVLTFFCAFSCAIFGREWDSLAGIPYWISGRWSESISGVIRF
jgi:hypothetical protein